MFPKLRYRRFVQCSRLARVEREVMLLEVRFRVTRLGTELEMDGEIELIELLATMIECRRVATRQGQGVRSRSDVGPWRDADDQLS